jgi:hypothetical protein
MLARTSVPLITTAAAVSSQEVSMARIVVAGSTAILLKEMFPHYNGVFAVVVIITFTDPGAGKAQTFIKALGRPVGNPYLESHPVGAQAHGLLHQDLEEQLPQAPAAVPGVDSHIGNVSFIKDNPHPSIANNLPSGQGYIIIGKIIVIYLI